MSDIGITSFLHPFWDVDVYKPINFTMIVAIPFPHQLYIQNPDIYNLSI